MKVGYHCSHEQFSPSDLLEHCQIAEKSGFQCAMSSDHIAPWSENQGHSGNVWSWLGAALHATKIPYGSLAIPGGWRYHPVVLAQSIATLAQIFPGRIPWIAAGSGEALNENMVGLGWPDKDERHLRLKTGVEMMRALWRGETITQKSGAIKAEEARLYSLPVVSPKIYGAALTAKTAEWLGGWADGLITTRQDPALMKEIISAFHKGGGTEKPLIVQMQVSWDSTLDQARQNAWQQWRSTLLGSEACANIKTTKDFDEAAQTISMDEVVEKMLISAKAEDHQKWIRECKDLGFSETYIHNTGLNPIEFMEFYKREVLPFI